MIKIKSVGMFRVQNRVIRTQFSTFPAPVVPRPGKIVVKTWPNYFSTLLTRKIWVSFGR